MPVNAIKVLVTGDMNGIKAHTSSLRLCRQNMFTMVALVLDMHIVLKTNASPFIHIKITLATRNAVLGASSSFLD